MFKINTDGLCYVILIERKLHDFKLTLKIHILKLINLPTGLIAS